MPMPIWVEITSPLMLNTAKASCSIRPSSRPKRICSAVARAPAGDSTLISGAGGRVGSSATVRTMASSRRARTGSERCAYSGSMLSAAMMRKNGHQNSLSASSHWLVSNSAWPDSMLRSYLADSTVRLAEGFDEQDHQCAEDAVFADHQHGQG